MRAVEYSYTRDLFAKVKRRHLQIERGELRYVAHQLDVLARAP